MEFLAESTNTTQRPSASKPSQLFDRLLYCMAHFGAKDALDSTTSSVTLADLPLTEIMSLLEIITIESVSVALDTLRLPRSCFPPRGLLFLVSSGVGTRFAFS